jgi:hypothetical protein
MDEQMGVENQYNIENQAEEAMNSYDEGEQANGEHVSDLTGDIIQRTIMSTWTTHSFSNFSTPMRATFSLSEFPHNLRPLRMLKIPRGRSLPGPARTNGALLNGYPP